MTYLPETKNETDYSLVTTPIAIVGMASIFPKAEALPDYWENILQKIDCITDVPSSRWRIEDYYDPDPNAVDKTYCKRGGFIPDIDFDPMEFGLPPNILEVTDVSQLLALVVARDALTDAGYSDEKGFSRERTGVILGVVGMSTKLFTPLMARLQYPIWEKVLLNSGVSADDTQKIIEKIKLAYVGWEENSFPGTIGNVIAGRIANRFDLGGTNCVVDAACASSLAAIRMAISELIEGRADMMITGGVDTDNSISTYMCFSKTPAFSKGEHVRSFDAQSDGMMVGEGLGMMVLKRLSDAERDGDRIYAVIKGIGSSSDGRFKSIYAPRPEGQAKALRRAYIEAGFEPETVGLIEAHGTGTMAGDPAEFQGLCEVFGKDGSIPQTIALGSVKSQISHTKATAGAASMIKVALSLFHKVLPPTLNVTRPNPKLNIENSPFYLNTETRPWIRSYEDRPRRAGVSSFGFGGTNFHVVVEEYQDDHSGAYRINQVPEMVLLSALTPEELLVRLEEMNTNLAGADGESAFVHLVNQSRTINLPVEHARIGFLAKTQTEAQEMVRLSIDLMKGKPGEETLEHPKGIFYHRTGLDTKGKVVALFSGQGSQYVEMGRELALNFPPVRRTFAQMDQLFVTKGNRPLSETIYPHPVFDESAREAGVEKLQRTENAQPAIGSMSVGLYRLLQEAGFRPDFTAGHSFGELTALWAAGVLNDQDYMMLAHERGQAMAAPEDPSFDAGTMMAVKGDIDRVSEIVKEIPGVTLANWNSNQQVVVAGAKSAITMAQQVLTEKGFSVVLLPVSAAFHTELVGHAQKPFAAAIKKTAFNAPSIQVYSNTSGEAYPEDPKDIRKILAEHILNPVRFRDEIQNIYSAGGRIFVEFGPKNVLTNLVGNILADQPHIAVALNANARKDSDRQLREGVLKLRVVGINLSGFDPYALPRKERPIRKGKGMSVRLNGGYYRTPKSLAAFEDALNDGFKVTTSETVARSIVEPIRAAPLQQTVVEEKQEVIYEMTPQMEQNGHESMEQIENTLSAYQSQQAEVARVHGQYLQNDGEYARIFARLTELEIGLVDQDRPMQEIQAVLESLERSMSRFQEHQGDTLQAHEQFLSLQAQYVQVANQLSGGAAVRSVPKKVVHPTPAPIYESPSETHQSSGNGNGHKPVQISASPTHKPEISGNGHHPVVSTQEKELSTGLAEYQAVSMDISKALLEVVSDKTGYPVEMLELDMDMEADLGIDSIKRVEILGAMQNRFPELPKVEPEALAELRTLGQIIEHLGSSTSALQPAHVDVETQTVLSPVEAVAVPRPTQGRSLKDLAEALLGVVSEKTGYPVEMLELDMDMEADLGIDSIKRVEILGSMQNLYPDLPKVEPEALAELRTLGQILNHLGGSVVEIGVPNEVSTAVQDVIFNTVTEQPLSESSQILSETISHSLVEIVSEKTGYPVEMLELDMDMEADLGIDSIKRVEILGAMQNLYPQLPKVDPEALAELRTLGQIIEYLSRPAGSAENNSKADPEDEPRFVESVKFSRRAVQVKALPSEPDSLESVFPANHVCLITDDGTSLTLTLSADLAARGLPVVVLSFPQDIIAGNSELPQSVHRVQLSELGDQHIQHALEEIHERYGKVAVFIHLNPTMASEMGSVTGYSGKEVEITRQIFLLAKHLKQDLNQAAGQGRAAFLSVVHLDGALGMGKDIEIEPVTGGLSGLVKTLNLEWESVFCRAIDLGPTVPAERMPAVILAEMNDPNRLICEVGYTAEGRMTLIAEESVEVIA